MARKGQRGKKRKKAQGRSAPARARPQRAPDTEVEAYEFIRKELRRLGWVVKNPSRATGGEVWTQNQCFAHPEIKQALGMARPENIVKLAEEHVWVIEAKAARKKIDIAIAEAVDDYAKPINDGPGRVRAVMATGVAGNEEAGYLIKTKVKLGSTWRDVTMNGQVATGLLSPEEARGLIREGVSDIREYAPDQWVFLQAAERTNEFLHIGGINKNDRAKTMAALLLAVLDDPPPNVNASLRVLVGEINSRSEAILRAKGKADFAPFVHILPPTNTTNHVKFKNAIVRTIQQLLNLNIRSAMNSSTDVLGQFYEVFLRYGNGAKEIGIVLTPRHVTRFAVEAVGVSNTDVVLDPACGTGGFLVAAFDHVRRTSTKVQTDAFRRRNLFGIEQESYVAVLAIVNMIFRGDGRNNIVEGNCFTTWLKRRTVNGHASAAYAEHRPEQGHEAVTRVLMNPPFKSDEKEYRFVSQALSVMADGGILFSLLPMDCMFGAHEEKEWRRNVLLAKHTLLAVLSFSHELFYPAALKQVIGIIVKKGFPHPREQPVYWARINRDGHLKLKSRRLPATQMKPPRDEPNHLLELLPSLQRFVTHPGSVDVNVPMLCKTTPIDFEDPLLELLPEAYIDTPTPSSEGIRRAVDELARETATFLIRFKKEGLAEVLHAND